MYQINYNGLKKRDTYDEIVSIIAGGGGVIKYPNRYATQLSNSPYMKQIDGETMLDLQEQSTRVQKEQLKQILLKEISVKTGTPYSVLHARTKLDRSEMAVRTAQTQLHDIAVGDDDVQDFRSAMGDSIADQQQREMDRAFRMTNLVAQQLSGIHISPINVEAKHTQTSFTPHDRATQMTPYREQSRVTEHNKKLIEQYEDLKQLYHNLLASEKHRERMKEIEKMQKQKQSESSSSSGVARNLMPDFVNTIGEGITKMLVGKKYVSPIKPTRAQSESPTPISSMEKEEIKSETPKREIKSMSTRKSSSHHSGMAQPVENVSRTPSDHVVMKQERSSSRPRSQHSGMAPVVGTASGSHSSKSFSVGSAVPASSGSKSQSPETIHSSQPSSGSRSRGRHRRG